MKIQACILSLLAAVACVQSPADSSGEGGSDALSPASPKPLDADAAGDTSNTDSTGTACTCTGEKGDAGETGPTGPQGEKGDKGEKGDPGGISATSFYYKVLTATMPTSGQPALGSDDPTECASYYPVTYAKVQGTCDSATDLALVGYCAKTNPNTSELVTEGVTPLTDGAHPNYWQCQGYNHWCSEAELKLTLLCLRTE